LATMAIWTCSTSAGLALLTIHALQALSSASAPILPNIDCIGDYTECWDCLLRRWSPTKLQFCCEHAHLGCGPVTTTQPQPTHYDCQVDHSDCRDCLLKRWSQGKLAWCCQHENVGCAPADQPKQPPTQPPATATTQMKKELPNAGKIAGGVLGGMAGAAALGLLGATVAEENHMHKEHVQELFHDVADAVPTTVPLQTHSNDSGSGTSWWWWCLPLLLLPLLGLCVPALKSLFHESEGTAHKTKQTKRSPSDDAECSSELPMLDTESTSTSMGQYMSQQSSLSPASIYQGSDQRIVSVPLAVSITPPKIKASLTPPRFVGYASPRQQLSPASSFLMEGTAGTSSSVVAPPATVVMRSGAVTPPAPSVLVAASQMQQTRLVGVRTPPVPPPSASVVVHQW